jgi:Tol biopolymer transport system component
MGGTTGASSSGGSGDSGAGGATGSGGTAGGAGAAGSGGSAGGGSIAELRSCPFGEPEPLVGFEFPSGSEWGASLSADGLTLYFAQTASGAGDLYRATRPDRGVTFSAPVALTGLNTDDDEGSPFISRDGLRLYFHSNRPEGLGGKDLYVATRSSVSAEFTSAELLANVNSADFDHLARLSPDELSLWFTSTREGGAGGADLWTASRASIDAAFGTPTVFDAINGSSSDESGGLTQDGLMLIFDSTRDGNSDIFTTTRASVDEAFAAPTRVADVNSTANEYNVFMTLDERELFFSSNRDSPTRHHLFRSLRSCD